MAASAAASFDQLRVFLHRFRRRLLLAFCIPFALALLLSLLATPRYVAQSVLIVRLGPEYVYQPETARSASAPNAPLRFDYAQMITSELAILTSSDLHQQVIDALGADTLFPELFRPGRLAWLTTAASSEAQVARQRKAAALESFKRRFEATLAKDSAVITLRFAHADDAVANQTLVTLLQHYFDTRRALYGQERAPLVQEQLEAKRAQAEAAEEALAEFKRQHRIFSLDTERSALLQQRAAAQAMGSNITHPALQQKVAHYDAQLAALNATEGTLALLQNETMAAKNAVMLYAQALDEAQAADARQHEQMDSVRVVQSPTTPAYPQSWRMAMVALGAVLSFGCALVVGSVSAATYDTAKVVDQLRRRRGRASLRLV